MINYAKYWKLFHHPVLYKPIYIYKLKPNRFQINVLIINKMINDRTYRVLSQILYIM